jgi:hypothetical protein
MLAAKIDSSGGGQSRDSQSESNGTDMPQAPTGASGAVTIFCTDTAFG